jgi:hypothetical protein
MWTDNDYYSSLPAFALCPKNKKAEKAPINNTPFKNIDILLLRLHSHVYDSYKANNISDLIHYSATTKLYENVAISFILLLITGPLPAQLTSLLLSIWVLVSNIKQYTNQSASYHLHIANLHMDELMKIYRKYKEAIAHCDYMICLCSR